MSRANIRYYETEGFLSPERRENGYRDYSEEDLETLKRIKLLRLLGVSLADIKAAKDGSLPLEELMARRLAGIARGADGPQPSPRPSAGSCGRPRSATRTWMPSAISTSSPAVPAGRRTSPGRTRSQGDVPHPAASWRGGWILRSTVSSGTFC